MSSASPGPILMKAGETAACTNYVKYKHQKSTFTGGINAWPVINVLFLILAASAGETADLQTLPSTAMAGMAAVEHFTS